ncbi:hypothetical protein OPQ81_000699 [Rhizoctonia solani]|nr:hypothetical protein OPQ81_000699 [Rhizoctonia solani]
MSEDTSSDHREDLEVSENYQARSEWQRTLLAYLNELAFCLRSVISPINLEKTGFLMEKIISHLEDNESIATKNLELVLETIRTFSLLIRYMTRVTKLPFLSGEILAAPFIVLILQYLRRFEEQKSSEDLHHALGYYALAISLVSDDIIKLPMRLRKLGDLYSNEFLRSRQLTYINLAIECYSSSIDITPPSDVNRRHCLNNLGNCYMLRFKALEKLVDLNNSIEYLSQALPLTPEGDPSLNALLSNCSMLYERRYKQLGNIDDINKSIECWARVISIRPKNDVDFAMRLKRFGGMYRVRFDHSGNLNDLNLAIECFQNGMACGSDNRITLADCANELGLAFHARFRYSAKIDDIENSIKYLTKAIHLLPPDNLDRPGCLSNLGNAHQWRFEHLADPIDIEKAIEYQNLALVSTNPGDRSLPGNLNNLGLSYKLRFENQGSVSDIDKAIEYQTRAVTLTPSNHPNIAIHVSNLGCSHDARFDRLHDTKDISAAIAFHTQALELTPHDHVTFPGRLSNLAGAYKRRFDILQNTSDINAAIEYRAQAVSLTPPNHAELPAQLSNLGMLHASRFQVNEDPQDLHQSIEYLSNALSLAPEAHPRLPGYLGNLAALYGIRSRFLGLGHPGDFQRAIELYTQALKMTPHGSLTRPHLLGQLGRVYSEKWERSADTSFLDRAIQTLREATECETGYPRIRFDAACRWADIASQSSRPDMVQAYQIALELVPQIVWLGTTIDRRYEDIRYTGILAMKAAAAAISAREYELAIEWLEQGRSIVWNQTLQLRTPMEELHAHDSPRATRLHELSKELHDLGSGHSINQRQNEMSLPPELVAQKHRRLAEEYEKILGEVRNLTGFENFLRPRKFQELFNATRTGPIVIVNAHASRCDALILRKETGGIHHVPLPNLSVSKIMAAHKHVTQYLQGLHLRDDSRIKFKQIGSTPPVILFESTLASLWHDLVQPVLNLLEYSPKSEIDQLPHITWCMTGPLLFLPIHAAGIYAHPSARMYDYAITSYTPTISSLLPFGSTESIDHSSLLAVGQEATPGHNPLPGTKEELARIGECVVPPLLLKCLEDHNATVAAVLEAMEKHNWVHLACHAHQDFRRPTESGFSLHDGPLTLKEIGKRAFKGKGLAFLSACQTARGDNDLPDESVHLASGMLTAGYPSVIATMWSVVDVDAPVVASTVYEYLLKDGKMNCNDTAKALHIAVKLLRDSVGEKEFGRWAPYIHIGA